MLRINRSFSPAVQLAISVSRTDSATSYTTCHENRTKQAVRTTPYFPLNQTNNPEDYLGGCTDPSLEDPVCNKGCDSLKDSDVVFDVPSKTWFCCGATDEGLITCNDPTKLVVSARPRPKLETTFVAQRTVLTTDVPPSTSETTTDATQSTSATTTTTSAPTITPTTPASSATEMPIPVEAEKVESNTGAIVGGVVGGVAAIAIIAGAVWFFYRRQQGQGPAQPPGYVPSHGFFGFVAEKPHNPRAELVTTERPVEMAGQRHSLAEMP